MCERKYNSYEVCITYLNGSREAIEYNEKDPRNYKQMLELYNQTKEQYQNECVTIQFTGIAKTGEIKVFFEKQIINEEELKIKQNADRVCVNDSEELLNNLIQIIEDLNTHRAYINGQVGIYNKKQDILLHKIENSDYDLNNKVNSFNELQQLRHDRRKIKNGSKLIEGFYSRITDSGINLIHLKNITVGCLERKKEQEEKIVPLTDEKVEEFKIAKEIKYKNFKERINLMKQLQSKYKKITYDDKQMTLYCYNNAQ